MPSKIRRLTSDVGFQKMPENVYCFDLDVDDNFEIFGAFKSKKMVSTIPALLGFYGKSDRNNWFAYDISVSSSKQSDIDKFFTKVRAFQPL